MGIFKKKFIWSLPPGVSLDFGYVCKLKKALYGLKKAPHAWFEKFTFVIFNLGYVSSVLMQVVSFFLYTLMI